MGALQLKWQQNLMSAHSKYFHFSAAIFLFCAHVNAFYPFVILIKTTVKVFIRLKKLLSTKKYRVTKMKWAVGEFKLNWWRKGDRKPAKNNKTTWKYSVWCISFVDQCMKLTVSLSLFLRSKFVFSSSFALSY